MSEAKGASVCRAGLERNCCNPVAYRQRYKPCAAVDTYIYFGADCDPTPAESTGDAEPLYTKAALDAAIADEREACAKVCDAGGDESGEFYAAAIRARSNAK